MYSIGVDVGGTFTDIVMVDDRTGSTWLAKVPSTPPNFEQGFMEGVRQVIAQVKAEPRAVDRLVHGTTVGTNAILERRGGRLGILMTQGFEDVLIIGRANRRRMYDLFMDSNEPLFLAERRQIAGIVERMGPDGSELIPLDPSQLVTEVERLVSQEHVEALVICFLHSYSNAQHELEARDLIRTHWPDVPVSLSAEVDPRFRESQRLILTAFDAYVRPPVVAYIKNLESALTAAGWSAPLQVMQSRGAITGAWTSIERPVGTVLSGPAAGVVGANEAARSAGFADLITIDIGGTSADVALVKGNRPVVSSDGDVDGYPLRLPMIDVKTIGAGGGSIGWIDPAGLLKVGPQSAGSRPGPACYGSGGTEPTVTDASLVLGYLDPESFAGSIHLDRNAARSAIDSRIGAVLGLGSAEAALGMHTIVNSRMAQALRLVSIERGEDPRALVLVALGGAGPVHAVRLAQEIGIPRVLIPATPGVCSALGLLYAPIEHEFSRTFRARASSVDLEKAEKMYHELDSVCARLMARDGVAEEHSHRRHSAEMRYVGQSHELEVPVESPLTQGELTAVVRRFHDLHGRVYSYSNDSKDVEFVTLRSVHSGLVNTPSSHEVPALHVASAPRVRPVCFDHAAGYVPTPVYRRTDLAIGIPIDGPAIVEQLDTTTVVYPGSVASIDRAGNIAIEVPPRAR